MNRYPGIFSLNLSPAALMKVAAVRAAIKDANGTFVTVKTRCKDGTITKHNGRTGVYKFTKLATPAAKPPLTLSSFTVWCPHKGGYRTVLMENVISISYAGRTQVFEGSGV